MQKLRKIHPYTLLLLVAFILNAVLPFFAVYNLETHGAVAQKIPSVFGERILICTGEGFKWVKQSDVQNGKEKPASHSDYKCPLCYAASHCAKALPVTLQVIARISPETAVPVLPYAPPLAPVHLALAHHVRAPPLSFIG